MVKAAQNDLISFATRQSNEIDKVEKFYKNLLDKIE